MSDQSFLSQIAVLGDSVKADIRLVQQNWRNLVNLQGDFAENDVRQTVYDCYPYLFRQLFPTVNNRQLHLLATAGRLFAASIIQYDKLVDGHSTNNDAKSLFGPLVMQWETQKILREIFEPKAPFWSRFESYYQDHIKACLTEASFRSQNQSWSEFTEELALDIAVGKNGISRAVAAGLVGISGDESLYHRLVNAINNFNVACQMLDDLVDWKKDLRDSAPSLLLARLFKQYPAADITQISDNKFIEHTAIRMYYDGHVQYVIEVGLSASDKSLNILKSLNGQETDWFKLVSKTKNKLEALLEDVDKIIKQNLQRISQQIEIEVELPPPRNDYQQLAQTALNFLIEQWRKGFGEARHIMNLSEAEGFMSERNSEYYYGDIFQRALLLETFCVVQNSLNVNLDHIIERELDYLIQNRCRDDAVGGWRYFTDVLEIAPDADDLGQIIQALVLSGNNQLVLEHCEKPLKVLLHNNLLENGAVETWVVPKINRTALQETQHQYNSAKWGSGPDNEVVANLFYGLSLYDSFRFKREIENGAVYLETTQESAGYWESRWYYGVFYGTHVCTRLIARVRPESDSLKKAREYLFDTQNADGGWGDGSRSDQLSTSLALLALSTCGISEVLKNQEKIIAGLKSLKRSLDEKEKWQLVTFIKPRIGEPYSSRTITAMYVCKAAAAWQSLMFGDGLANSTDKR